MKQDIVSKEDVALLVNTFYDRVKQSPAIGHMFRHVDWDKHLPVMYQFWDNAIFFSGGYSGNPLQSHQRMHQVFPLTKEHFQEWLHLFTSTVDALFEGEKASLAKQRATSIATVMQLKIC